MEDTLLKKLEAYKQGLTFDEDKAKIEAWERAVNKAIVKTEAMKLDGIRELVALMKVKIQGCDKELLENRDLNEDERKRTFDRREIWKWVISFFEDAQQIVESVPKQIEELEKE